jgi:uncharacterized protein involved in high-affinity Fe2+ transport
MKSIIAILLLALTACASPPKAPEKLSAQVLSIRQAHDSYDDGRFKFYTVVTYRIVNSENPEKTIQRYFDIGSPELNSLAVGQIVTLKE